VRAAHGLVGAAADGAGGAPVQSGRSAAGAGFSIAQGAAGVGVPR
jgi:hypothetical protein